MTFVLVPEPFVSSPPHAFRLEGVRVQERSRAAQAQPDCAGALSRTILRAIAPARVTQVIAITAAEAIAARRVVDFLRAPPAQRAGEPPSKPAQVRPSGLKETGYSNRGRGIR
jgi:hypothetical protein